MSKVGAALGAELLKIRKSKMLWMTLLGFALAPLMSGFMMFILKNPEFARNAGLLSAKAQLQGVADWPSFFGQLAEIVAIGGIVLFGFVTSWVFGREYSDRTAKDLLALPVPRATIVLSKLIAVLLWCLLLTLLVVVLGLLVGSIIGLPGWSAGNALHGVMRVMECAGLTVILSTPVAFFASYGRGYMPPLGFVVLAIVVAQIIGAIGYGAYFPWSIPALFSGMAGPGNGLSAVSYMLLVLTGLAGLIGTLAWWRYADQH